MSKGGFQNPKYANQSGSTSGYGSQGNFGMGYPPSYGGAGTYDPMLGFGQASGMGTTYNAPTRYTADYTRFLQSGQQFNQPVMGYNSYGQIFAQPQRPPAPTMGGKGGGGPRRSPSPTMGGKGGQVGSPGVPSTGFDPEGYFRNRPVRGPRGDQGSRGGYGNFLDFYNRQNNNVVGPFTGGFGNSVPSPPFGGFGNNVPEPGPQGLPSPLVDKERIFPGQDIANSPFGQLIGQPAAQPTMAQQGANISNPDRDRAREITMRSYNSPSSITAEDMAFLQQYDARPSNPADLQAQQAAQRQMAAGNTFGLSGMPTSGPQIRPDYIPVMGERNFDMQGFNMPSQPFNFGQGFGRMAFQEGGQVPPDAASNMDMMLSEAGPANPQSEMAGEYDRLIQMTMQAVLGQTENADEIIQMFIDEFGADAFRQLRDAVLKQQVPGAQTEGMVDGNGGGMDDQVMGMIGNQRPVAVSPGEYIVPADVVSGLGDGSSKSGADILDELNQAVRMARTGTTEQPRPLAESMR